MSKAEGPSHLWGQARGARQPITIHRLWVIAREKAVPSPLLKPVPELNSSPLPDRFSLPTILKKWHETGCCRLCLLSHRRAVKKVGNLPTKLVVEWGILDLCCVLEGDDTERKPTIGGDARKERARAILTRRGVYIFKRRTRTVGSDLLSKGREETVIALLPCPLPEIWDIGLIPVRMEPDRHEPIDRIIELCPTNLVLNRVVKIKVPGRRLVTSSREALGEPSRDRRWLSCQIILWRRLKEGLGVRWNEADIQESSWNQRLINAKDLEELKDVSAIAKKLECPPSRFWRSILIGRENKKAKVTNVSDKGIPVRRGPKTIPRLREVPEPAQEEVIRV
ncbi:MAG: hypothetical protein QXT91_00675 [Candidatus Caldarchaeum sp.]